MEAKSEKSSIDSFYIYVPAYNEAENLPELLCRFDSLVARSLNFGVLVKVVIVDDCSTDNTNEVLQSAKFKYAWLDIIRHPQNRNLVGVLETFLVESEKNIANDSRLLGFGLLDGDNSHDPNAFLEMFFRIWAGYDIVIASRYRPGSTIVGVSWFRQLLSKGVSILFNSIGGVPGVRDYSCGFRAYSKEVIKANTHYKFQFRSFACMAELLIALSLQNAKACEIPFVLRYDRKKGESKMRFLPTISETLMVLFSFRIKK